MFFFRALTRPLASSSCAFRQGITTTAASWKASQPAYVEEAHESDDECAFQTRIGEVLQLKEEDTPKLWCADKDLVIEAVRKMAKNNVGSLLVFDKKAVMPHHPPSCVETCVGIITERDYLTKVVVEGRNSLTTHVQEIMTPAHKLKMLTPEHSVLEAMEIMIHHNVRHVPVMDKKAMVGILSIKDVVKVLLDDQKAEIHQLKDYIHGSY